MTTTNMITAEQARSLVENSHGAVLNRILPKISEAIRRNAETGQTSLMLSSIRKDIDPLLPANKCDDFALYGAKELIGSTHDAPCKFAEHAMLTFKQYGYLATITGEGMPYVPRGLDDGYGDGPQYFNWTVVLEW